MKLLSRNGVKKEVIRILFDDLVTDIDFVEEIMRVYDSQVEKLIYLERKRVSLGIITPVEPLEN